MHATGELKTGSLWFKSRINSESWRNFAKFVTFLNIKLISCVQFSYPNLLYFPIASILNRSNGWIAGFNVAGFRLSPAYKSTQNLFLDLKRKLKKNVFASNISVHWKTMYKKKNLCVGSVVTLLLLRLVAVFLEFFFPKKKHFTFVPISTLK